MTFVSLDRLSPSPASAETGDLVCVGPRVYVKSPEMLLDLGSNLPQSTHPRPLVLPVTLWLRKLSDPPSEGILQLKHTQTHTLTTTHTVIFVSR